jgi:hypothetical protein
MDGHSLRDDLFLLAHDDAGRLTVHEATIEAGLAGAALIDLLLTGRVAVLDGRLAVIDQGPTGDSETDATIDAIAANTEPCGPRAWVSWIAQGSYQRIGDGLVAAGRIDRTTVRRLGLVTATRCLPTDDADLVRVRSRLRFAIHGKDQPDPATAAMCGLVRVLRMEASLLLSMPTSELLLALERLAADSELAVRQVTSAVEAVITAATYR